MESGPLPLLHSSHLVGRRFMGVGWTLILQGAWNLIFILYGFENWEGRTSLALSFEKPKSKGPETAEEADQGQAKNPALEGFLLAGGTPRLNSSYPLLQSFDRNVVLSLVHYEDECISGLLPNVWDTLASSSVDYEKKIQKSPEGAKGWKDRCREGIRCIESLQIGPCPPTGASCKRSEHTMGTLVPSNDDAFDKEGFAKWLRDLDEQRRRKGHRAGEVDGDHPSHDRTWRRRQDVHPEDPERRGQRWRQYRSHSPHPSLQSGKLAEKCREDARKGAGPRWQLERFYHQNARQVQPAKSWLLQHAQGLGGESELQTEALCRSTRGFETKSPSGTTPECRGRRLDGRGRDESPVGCGSSGVTNERAGRTEDREPCKEDSTHGRERQGQRDEVNNEERQGSDIMENEFGKFARTFLDRRPTRRGFSPNETVDLHGCPVRGTSPKRSIQRSTNQYRATFQGWEADSFDRASKAPFLKAAYFSIRWMLFRPRIESDLGCAIFQGSSKSTEYESKSYRFSKC